MANVKKQTVYIAVSLLKDKPPVLLGVFRTQKAAEAAAYSPDVAGFANVIKAELKD